MVTERAAEIIARARELTSDEARAQARYEHELWLGQHDPFELDYTCNKREADIVTREAPPMLYRTKDDALCPSHT